MKASVQEMSSSRMSKNQLKAIVEKSVSKKKRNDVPWVTFVKRCIAAFAENDSEILFFNVIKLVRSHAHRPLKDGLPNTKKAETLLESYSDLIVYINYALEECNKDNERLRLTAAILPATIDLKVQLVGEETDGVGKIIYNKLTLYLGESTELIVDTLLHCQLLIYTKLREPTIFIPIIKYVLTSLKNNKSQLRSLSPLPYLKYLTLGKYWLFMVPKEELVQTRAYIIKLLKMPSSFVQWVLQSDIPWLKPKKFNTKSILKSIKSISAAMQTLYSKEDKVSSMEVSLPGKKKKGKSVRKSEIKSDNGTDSQNPVNDKAMTVYSSAADIVMESTVKDAKSWTGEANQNVLVSKSEIKKKRKKSSDKTDVKDSKQRKIAIEEDLARLVQECMEGAETSELTEVEPEVTVGHSKVKEKKTARKVTLKEEKTSVLEHNQGSEIDLVIKTTEEVKLEKKKKKLRADSKLVTHEEQLSVEMSLIEESTPKSFKKKQRRIVHAYELGDNDLASVNNEEENLAAAVPATPKSLKKEKKKSPENVLTNPQCGDNSIVDEVDDSVSSVIDGENILSETSVPEMMIAKSKKKERKSNGTDSQGDNDIRASILEDRFFSIVQEAKEYSVEGSSEKLTPKSAKKKKGNKELSLAGSSTPKSLKKNKNRQENLSSVGEVEDSRSLLMQEECIANETDPAKSSPKLKEKKKQRKGVCTDSQDDKDFTSSNKVEEECSLEMQEQEVSLAEELTPRSLKKKNKKKKENVPTDSEDYDYITSVEAISSDLQRLEENMTPKLKRKKKRSESICPDSHGEDGHSSFDMQSLGENFTPSLLKEKKKTKSKRSMDLEDQLDMQSQGENTTLIEKLTANSLSEKKKKTKSKRSMDLEDHLDRREENPCAESIIGCTPQQKKRKAKAMKGNDDCPSIEFGKTPSCKKQRKRLSASHREVGVEGSKLDFESNNSSESTPCADNESRITVSSETILPVSAKSSPICKEKKKKKETFMASGNKQKSCEKEMHATTCVAEILTATTEEDFETPKSSKRKMKLKNTSPKLTIASHPADKPLKNSSPKDVQTGEGRFLDLNADQSTPTDCEKDLHTLFKSGENSTERKKLFLRKITKLIFNDNEEELQLRKNVIDTLLDKGKSPIASVDKEQSIGLGVEMYANPKLKGNKEVVKDMKMIKKSRRRHLSLPATCSKKERIRTNSWNFTVSHFDPRRLRRSFGKRLDGETAEKSQSYVHTDGSSSSNNEKYQNTEYIASKWTESPLVKVKVVSSMKKSSQSLVISPQKETSIEGEKSSAKTKMVDCSFHRQATVKFTSDTDSDITVIAQSNAGAPTTGENGSSEVDEATGSDGDIIPCDENNKMFTDEETREYHQRVLNETLQLRMQTSKVSGGEAANWKSECVDFTSHNLGSTNEQSKDGVWLLGGNDKEEDIDAVLETIVRDTGKKSSIEGLREEFKTTTQLDHLVEASDNKRIDVMNNTSDVPVGLDLEQQEESQGNSVQDSSSVVGDVKKWEDDLPDVCSESNTKLLESQYQESKEEDKMVENFNTKSLEARNMSIVILKDDTVVDKESSPDVALTTNASSDLDEEDTLDDELPDLSINYGNHGVPGEISSAEEMEGEDQIVVNNESAFGISSRTETNEGKGLKDSTDASVTIDKEIEVLKCFVGSDKKTTDVADREFSGLESSHTSIDKQNVKSPMNDRSKILVNGDSCTLKKTQNNDDTKVDAEDELTNEMMKSPKSNKDRTIAKCPKESEIGLTSAENESALTSSENEIKGMSTTTKPLGISSPIYCVDDDSSTSYIESSDCCPGEDSYSSTVDVGNWPTSRKEKFDDNRNISQMDGEITAEDSQQEETVSSLSVREGEFTVCDSDHGEGGNRSATLPDESLLGDKENVMDDIVSVCENGDRSITPLGKLALIDDEDEISVIGIESVKNDARLITPLGKGVLSHKENKIEAAVSGDHKTIVTEKLDMTNVENRIGNAQNIVADLDDSPLTLKTTTGLVGEETTDILKDTKDTYIDVKEKGKENIGALQRETENSNATDVMQNIARTDPESSLLIVLGARNNREEVKMSTNGDEAYEASSDASEEDMPLCLRKTCFQRKASLSQVSSELADSDCSPRGRGRRSSGVHKKQNLSSSDKKNDAEYPQVLSDLTFNRDTDKVRRIRGRLSESYSLKESETCRTGFTSIEQSFSDSEISSKYTKRGSTSGTKDASHKFNMDTPKGTVAVNGKPYKSKCQSTQSDSVVEVSSDGKSSVASNMQYRQRMLRSTNQLKESTHSSVLESNECDDDEQLFVREIEKREGYSCKKVLDEDEGDEIEVLSTSSVDDDEEDTSSNTSVIDRQSPKSTSEQGKVNSLSHKHGKHMSQHSPKTQNPSGKKLHSLSSGLDGMGMPLTTVLRVSEAVLVKEVLISPEVSDEECELVSPGLFREDNFLKNRKNLKMSEGSVNALERLPSKLGLTAKLKQGGIRSPQKVIPEEQDESAPIKTRSAHTSKGSPGYLSPKKTARASPSEEPCKPMQIRKPRRLSRNVPKSSEGSLIEKSPLEEILNRKVSDDTVLNIITNEDGVKSDKTVELPKRSLRSKNDNQNVHTSIAMPLKGEVINVSSSKNKTDEKRNTDGSLSPPMSLRRSRRSSVTSLYGTPVKAKSELTPTREEDLVERCSDSEDIRFETWSTIVQTGSPLSDESEMDNKISSIREDYPVSPSKVGRPKKRPVEIINNSLSLKGSLRTPKSERESELTRTPSSKRQSELTRTPSNRQSGLTRTPSSKRQFELTRTPSSKRQSESAQTPSSRRQSESARTPSSRRQSESTRTPSRRQSESTQTPSSKRQSDCTVAKERQEVDAKDETTFKLLAINQLPKTPIRRSARLSLVRGTSEIQQLPSPLATTSRNGRSSAVKV